MSEKLLESDFLNVDLRSIINKVNGGSTSSATATPTAEAEANSPVENVDLEVLPADWDEWKNLLITRLDNNKRATDNKKKPESEVESEFFEEFFRKNWPDSQVAEQLISNVVYTRDLSKPSSKSPAKVNLIMMGGPQSTAVMLGSSPSSFTYAGTKPTWPFHSGCSLSMVRYTLTPASFCHSSIIS